MQKITHNNIESSHFVLPFRAGLGRWTLHGGTLIHFYVMLSWSTSSEAPVPPSPLMLSPDRIVLQKSSRRECTSGGVWICQTFVCPSVLFCCYRRPIL